MFPQKIKFLNLPKGSCVGFCEWKPWKLVREENIGWKIGMFYHGNPFKKDDQHFLEMAAKDLGSRKRSSILDF